MFFFPKLYCTNQESNTRPLMYFFLSIVFLENTTLKVKLTWRCKEEDWGTQRASACLSGSCYATVVLCVSFHSHVVFQSCTWNIHGLWYAAVPACDDVLCYDAIGQVSRDKPPGEMDRGAKKSREGCRRGIWSFKNKRQKEL